MRSGRTSMTKGARVSWYSISVEYKPIPPEQQAARGEWYLQATLIHEYGDTPNALQTEITPLGRIDFDALSSVEQRTAFWAITDEALDRLGLEGETRNQITAELTLVVRLPTDDMVKRPRIGLGALFPGDK
ncbi:MAG: hypothetical protein ACXVI3_06295 [Halobacteriota archaeon]